MFIGGAVAAFAGLSIVGLPVTTAAFVALAAGFSGAIVEAVSTHGLDNLTVQLAAAAAASMLG